jgi:uncharacterized protein YhbP (UPF0306 family)
MSIKELIREYLSQAKLMQIATSINNQPWVCSVWFAADEDLNIYWFSSETRRHSLEVARNKHVAGTIVLPQTPKDPPRGLQFQGTAQLIEDQPTIDKAILLYQDRIFSKDIIMELMNDNTKPHRFYILKPIQFILFDAVNFANTEWRQELNLT